MELFVAATMPHWLGTAVGGTVIAAMMYVTARVLLERGVQRTIACAGAILTMAGAGMNALVIQANGDRMPVTTGDDWENAPRVPIPGAVCRMIGTPEWAQGNGGEGGVHDKSIAEPALPFLADWIPLTACVFVASFSFGDFIIFAGLILPIAALPISRVVRRTPASASEMERS